MLLCNFIACVYYFREKVLLKALQNELTGMNEILELLDVDISAFAAH